MKKFVGNTKNVIKIISIIENDDQNTKDRIIWLKFSVKDIDKPNPSKLNPSKIEQNEWNMNKMNEI